MSQGLSLLEPVPGRVPFIMSELKGFMLAWRVELLVRDQTLVLCLKAALTFKGRTESSLEAISEVEKSNSKKSL